MLRAILIFLYFSGFMADEGPLVQTSLGKIRGFYKKSFGGRLYSAFEGIPYAKPPIGDLRFEPPQPAPSWSGILQANASYICKQAENALWPTSTEDCLYLNVYVPNSEVSEKDDYDVIVYIHGGGFMVGSSAMNGPMYFMDRDIIYVNMNYRLGILGFLSTEDETVPGNNGLKDQQLALKWVQSHIKKFGGNPKSVTLMGLSAGGASVHFHYFSHQSKGLFHRGISQSGTALMPWTIQDGALQKTKSIAASLNCPDTDTRALVNCLKSFSADDLNKQTKNFYDLLQLPFAPFAPVVEVESKHSFMTKHPYEQLESGTFNDIPWLTWIAKDEGILCALYVDKMLDEVESKWSEWLEHLLDYKHACPEVRKKEVAEKIKSFYFKNEKISENNIKSLIKVFSDRLFNVGYEIALEMQSKVANSPVYAAIYGYDKSTSMKKLLQTELEGVTHGAEMPLLHDMNIPLDIFQLSNSDVLMKDVLIDFVTSFTSNEKPNSNTVEWEPYTTNDPKYLIINDFNDLSMKQIPELTPKNFWNNLGLLENKQAVRVHEEL